MRIGVDIGGTKTDAVVIDDHGRLTDRIRLSTGFGAEAVVDSAVAAITELVERTGVDLDDARSVGIGIPGTVDSASGHVSHAVNLGFDTLDLGDRLEERLGVRVCVENDVKAAALGAYSLLALNGPASSHRSSHGSSRSDGERPSRPDPGASAAPSRPLESMAYLNLGTGLAAGLVLSGELWRGSWGAAGEIGHIPIDPSGALCPCGQRGCLETVASGSGISRQWRTADALPAQSLFRAADDGDPYAVDVRNQFIAGIASAVRILVLTVDVDTVVIGGGLSNLGAPLLDAVTGVLATWADDSPFIASLDLGRRVELLPAGFPAAAVGAALVGLHGDRIAMPENTHPAITHSAITHSDVSAAESAS